MSKSYTKSTTIWKLTRGSWLINALIGCLIASSATNSVAVAQTADLPDIVYLISDDQAWTDYSFMGHKHIQTPNLDELARESLLFTRGYVPDSLCRPSLATMITGLYPHQHGIVGNDPPPSLDAGNKNRGGNYRNPEYQKDIESFLQAHADKLETLPDRLKKLGYQSFQTGKWWEGNFSRGGFDDGMTHGNHNRGARHGDVGLKIGRETMQPIADYVASSKKAGKPYFLWYAPMLPHTPHDPPTDLLNKYKAVAPTESIAKYWAMCEHFDNSIGQLLEIIKTKGRPDNTLIVYVCDNGWINLPDKSAYAPKSKRSQYDGGVRTPIMFHWPAKIAARRDEQNLASSIDLVPTVMSLVGAPVDSKLPGINLADENQVKNRKSIFGEIFEHDIVSQNVPASSLMYRWIIDGNMKLIVSNLKQVPDGQVELYDLAADPTEERNLAAEQLSVVAKLTRQLDTWWQPESSKP